MLTQILGKVQHYDWGKVDEGFVYTIEKSNNSSLEKNTKYAEYWMGTHKNGCSTLLNGSLLSDKVDLPFLFKILSVNKALSIQAHPDKILAEKLHLKDPTNYKDDNHKPEMCICLSDSFEALSGFCSDQKFNENLHQLPEFHSFIGNGSFKDQFKVLMNCKKQDIENQITIVKTKPKTPLIELILTLNVAYPNDVGVFCPVFMNYVKLTKYQALFMAANEPHAYLKGCCVECMANSDNVVRAGLTPKFRDVNNLIDMLTYKRYEIEELLVHPVKNGDIMHYKSPVKEFDVYKIESNSQGTINSFSLI